MEYQRCNEELTSGALIAKALRKAQNNVNCDIRQKAPVQQSELSAWLAFPSWKKLSCTVITSGKYTKRYVDNAMALHP